MSATKNDGFLILIVAGVVEILHFLSLVEWVKYLGGESSGLNNATLDSEKKRRIANIWIDAFIVFKWVSIGLLFYFQQTGWTAFFFASYLLFFNLFSYFYYHAWGSSFQVSGLSNERMLWRDRRRLVSFLLALAFSFFGFAYLYSVQFPAHFQWPTGSGAAEALYLSISNSFAVTVDGFAPISYVARWLLLLQILNTFFFLTILISNSIPSVGKGSTT